jgi:ribA/ribD-fused uncharacterized protein
MIDRFIGEYEALSNFYPSPIAVIIGVNEVCYVMTAEHAYQVNKTFSPEWRSKIAVAATPGAAKRIGKNAPLREDWEEVKADIMHHILYQKFTTSTTARSVLLGTGDQELIEGNMWHDTYWGKCQCSTHYGMGTNMLGKILMKVRNEVR